MTLLPFLAVAVGGGTLTLLVRRNGSATVVVGLVALLVAAGAAFSIGTEEPISIGGGSLAGTEFARLFLAFGCVAGIGLVLVGLATDRIDELPAATLLVLGAAAIALGTPDPVIGTLAVATGGLAGLLVGMPRGSGPLGVASAARMLRAAGVAAVAAIAAAVWTTQPIEAVTADPAIVGLALLGFAVALGLRLGAIPFHGWAARLPDGAPELALPLILAWGPAALAVVALGWSDAMAAALAEPLGIERALVVALGLLTLLLGVTAAILHDDLEHVLVYSMVADGGIILLALGALDPDAWGPARIWLLAFAVSRSAFAAWVVAIRATFGTRRLHELGGWARRAPLLALALVAIGAAIVGWPGLAVFEARSTLAQLSLGRPLSVLVTVGAIGTLAYLGRILAAGFARPSAAVAAGATSRPRWPAGRRSDLRGIARQLSPAVRTNRVPLAGVLVVALAVLALAVGGGAFGVAAAAAAAPPQAVADVEAGAPAP